MRLYRVRSAFSYLEYNSPVNIVWLTIIRNSMVRSLCCCCMSACVRVHTCVRVRVCCVCVFARPRAGVCGMCALACARMGTVMLVHE